MFVKICGLTDDAGLQAAVAAGADAVGFVFAESSRRVSPARATRLCRDLPKNLIRVAVMRHPSIEEWQTVREEFAPHWLQTDASDFEKLKLATQCAALPVYRNGQQTNASETTRILFEGRNSGRGEVADWQEAAAIAGETQVILAGGLNPSNVADAIQTVFPWGVDVSSGVEMEPGKKDPVKIKQFVARVRAVEYSK